MDVDPVPPIAEERTQHVSVPPIAPEIKLKMILGSVQAHNKKLRDDGTLQQRELLTALTQRLSLVKAMSAADAQAEDDSYAAQLEQGNQTLASFVQARDAASAALQKLGDEPRPLSNDLSQQQSELQELRKTVDEQSTSFDNLSLAIATEMETEKITKQEYKDGVAACKALKDEQRLLHKLWSTKRSDTNITMSLSQSSLSDAKAELQKLTGKPSATSAPAPNASPCPTPPHPNGADRAPPSPFNNNPAGSSSGVPGGSAAPQLPRTIQIPADEESLCALVETLFNATTPRLRNRMEHVARSVISGLFPDFERQGTTRSSGRRPLPRYNPQMKKLVNRIARSLINTLLNVKADSDIITKQSADPLKVAAYNKMRSPFPPAQGGPQGGPGPDLDVLELELPVHKNSPWNQRVVELLVPELDAEVSEEYPGLPSELLAATLWKRLERFNGPWNLFQRQKGPDGSPIEDHHQRVDRYKTTTDQVDHKKRITARRHAKFKTRRSYLRTMLRSSHARDNPALKQRLQGCLDLVEDLGSGGTSEDETDPTDATRYRTLELPWRALSVIPYLDYTDNLKLQYPGCFSRQGSVRLKRSRRSDSKDERAPQLGLPRGLYDARWLHDQDTDWVRDKLRPGSKTVTLPVLEDV